MKHHLILVLALGLTTSSASANTPIIADDTPAEYNYNLDNDDNLVCNDLPDPFEKINRKIFFFNSFLDYIILKPIAKAYGKVFNDYTKARIGSAVDNIQEPLSTVNYALQGDAENSLKSFWKFAINSTLGIGGLFDIAGKTGLDPIPQTFGSTLAHYGVSPGPYIVIPILGSTNMRDMWDVIVTDDKLNPVKYALHSNAKTAYTVVKLVHKRNEIMPFTDHISKTSPDPYAAIRSAMHQRREKMVHYPAGYRCGHRPLKDFQYNITK